ncbi:MAG: carbon-nitrogen hydrolase family protein, partial [Thermoplasmata archaeon]|nr:carbon-nitrogen hydrolase family protein [Thermoplasmata archaeon]
MWRMNSSSPANGQGNGTTHLTLAAAQFEPRPGDVRWNISRSIELAARAGVQGADLVVLPELGTTGYYMFDRFRDLAEPLDGPTITIMTELASRWDFHVVVGLAERAQDDQVYDSAVLVGPRGVGGVYRKTHLWDRERDVFAPGTDPPVVEAGARLGRLGLLVCYDLEFPETADLVHAGNGRLLAAPAAFGNLTLWKATLETRVRDLGIPLVAANRLGVEGDTRFCGHSMVIAADGEVLADAGTSQGIAMAEVILGPIEERGRGKGGRK